MSDPARKLVRASYWLVNAVFSGENMGAAILLALVNCFSNRLVVVVAHLSPFKTVSAISLTHAQIFSFLRKA